MGKKPVAKAKAKAEPEPQEPAKTPEEIAEEAERRRIFTQRKEAFKWAQAQLAIVRNLVEAAKKRSQCDWLLIAHEFHEVSLIKLSKRLDEKKLDSAPQELRDGVEAYIAQCKTPEVQHDGFQEFREVWNLVSLEDGVGYVRFADSPETVEVIQGIKVWSDGSVEGIRKLSGLMKSHLPSAGVQEAALVRLGGLFSEARDGAALPGLTAAGVMPCIEAAMKAHLLDAEVERAGCAAMRGLAMVPGQLPPLCEAGGVKLAVEALRTHYKLKEVVLTSTALFSEMAKQAGRNSPELSEMIQAGVVEILLKVMDHHAWDQTLCGKVRVVLPFIQGD